MVEISYNTVMVVIESWDRLKKVDNYQEKAGELLFLRLFEMEPSARELFKFTKDENIRTNPKFYSHAKTMINMIDGAVAFLGPDLDPLREDLQELGKRHITKYGVPAKYLHVMEKAVIYALEEVLDTKFTREDYRAWEAVFYFMITEMAEGMSQIKEA